MGCRCSTAVSEPLESSAKGTPASALPIQEEKVVAGDGSDTSTDDISSSSHEVSAQNSDPIELMMNEVFLDEPDKEGDNALEHSTLDEGSVSSLALDDPLMKGSALRILHHQLGIDLTLSESEASTPRGPATEPEDTSVRRDSSGQQADSPVRRVSCLSGTSQREKGRRVSFSEAGPEVVHVEVEPLERSLNTLRRANAVSAEDVEENDYLEHMAIPMTWNDPDGEDEPAYNPYEPDVDFEIVTISQSRLPPEPPEYAGRFGFCCVPHYDGTQLYSAELEYDVSQEGEDSAIPYAASMHHVSQSQALPPRVVQLNQL